MPKTIAEVARHDAENRRPDSPAEEAELQARIAKNLKPLDVPVAPKSPVMATPAAAAALAPQPEREDIMPDGTSLTLNREQRLEIALRNLVNKLDEMSSDDSFKTVWRTATAAGVKYTGPLWKPEVDFARTLLK